MQRRLNQIESGHNWRAAIRQRSVNASYLLKKKQPDLLKPTMLEDEGKLGSMVLASHVERRCFVGKNICLRKSCMTEVGN